jgi:hypothetical protein
MKIQNSRNSKQDDKDYSAVCHQQGRMITDFDLNEQALISRDRLNQALKDVIGSGTPRCDALLQVDDENIPSLHWGKIYVDGIAAEARRNLRPLDPIEPPVFTNPDVEELLSASKKANKNNKSSSAFDYDQQLYFPQAPERPQTPYKFYADVWDRTVIWLEDEKLRDPGLYGADTTTRTQTMAQIKWCDQDTDPMCLPSIGDARLLLTLRSLSNNTDPCDPCAENLELNDPVGNYHFRAEVHDVHYDKEDKPDVVVLKWSSENGAEAYKATDLPPDFASNKYVYEYFDEVSEKQLGKHPAHDNSKQSLIDGKRSDIQNELSNTPPKEYVRRWNGWCKIEKTGANWEVAAGFEGAFDLTSGINSGPGKVINGSVNVTIELDVITLTIKLKDKQLLAGDYWNTAVREAIHKQGDILLQDKDSNKGALPNGEHHHYMLLVNVDEEGTMRLPAGSDCDKYQACQPPQFPSLTDLRADDICYDSSGCELSDATTVQGALDQLCKKNDLPWHNKHLHGWGIVCGLALTCIDKQPNKIRLSSGYALDCEGQDLILDQDVDIDVIKGIKEAKIKISQTDENQGICLYLQRDKNQLTVQFENYQEQENSWQDRLKNKLNDSLLMEFYNECVLRLINSLKAELNDPQVKSQCVLTECGKQHIPPTKRRTLAISNIAFHKNPDQSNSVLNVSSCEHSLLKDLYDNLLKILSSKTFCGLLNSSPFPNYPFKDSCRATWFAPDQLDHLRVHPQGKLLFGWKRQSPNIYVFSRSETGCTGDLLYLIKAPIPINNSITDLIVDSKNNIYISATVKNNSLIAATKLNRKKAKNCQAQLIWQEQIINRSKIVKLQQSPWSNEKIFAVSLCQGVYLFDKKSIFNDSSKQKVKWAFPASGHMVLDPKSNRVFATAYQNDKETQADSTKKIKVNLNNEANPNTCVNGYYNRIVSFDGKSNQTLRITTAIPFDNINASAENNGILGGNDGLVIVPSNNSTISASDNLTSAPVRATTEIRRPNFVLYMVINEGNNKLLYRFEANGTTPINDTFVLWGGENYHPFGADDHIALKYIKNQAGHGIIASRYSHNDIQYIPNDRNRYDADLLTSIPVQAGPVDLGNNASNQQIFILNHQGQSITVLDYKLRPYQQQRGNLQEYRNKVLDAYTQLLSRVLQYLKDCFCHKLLVECPAKCNDEDKVYLGCVSINENGVHNICNFTKRKYVKTFPTMSYWLSIIPIGPIVSWAIEEICCLIIPNFNNQQDTGALTLNNQQLNLSRAALNIDQSLFADRLTADSKKLFKQTITSFINNGQQEKFSLKQIEKAQYTYRPGVIKPQTIKITAVDNKQFLKRVTKIEQQNAQILTRFDQVNPVENQTKTEIATLTNKIQELDLQNTSNNELIENIKQVQAADKKLISTMTSTNTSSQATIKTLSQQIKVLNENKVNSDKIIIAFQEQFKSLEKFRVEALKDKPVFTLKGINPKNQAILKKSKIVTVQQLADTPVAQLTGLGISPRMAANIIKIANTKLKP